jgi:citrate synthase
VRGVKIGRQDQALTSVSTSNESTIVVRGHDLARELIGHVDFVDHFWLLVTGGLPAPAQKRVLNAALVAIAEHGLVPSVAVARMTLAASPEALQGAVAAGLLGCGSVVLGSSEAAGQFLAKVVERAGPEGRLDGAIADTVAEYRAARRAIPGFGHPLHADGDPRAARLFAVAAEAGLLGRHCGAARATEQALPALLGRTLAINVSGAIPAVLLDAGFPLLALKGVPLLARAGGLIAHLLEEQLRPIGFILAHSGAGAIAYDGPAPAGFVPSGDA